MFEVEGRTSTGPPPCLYSPSYILFKVSYHVVFDNLRVANPYVFAEFVSKAPLLGAGLLHSMQDSIRRRRYTPQPRVRRRRTLGTWGKQTDGNPERV